MLRLLLLLFGVGVAGEGANSTYSAPTNATQSQGIFFADNGTGGETGDVPADIPVDDADIFPNATATEASQNSTPVPTATSRPTNKPTMRCRPGRACPPAPAPPTTPPPTLAPLVSSPIPLVINLVIYVENVPERSMSDKEKRDYVQVMTDFLKANAYLNKNGVRTSRLATVGHGLIQEEEEEEDRGGGGGGGESIVPRPSRPSTSRGKARKLPGEARKLPVLVTSGFVYSYNQASQYVPHTYPAVYILTRVEASSRLPPAVAAFFLWDELRRGEETLIAEFYAKRFFNSYFKTVTNITGEVVERLTKRPSPAPTRLPTAPPTSDSKDVVAVSGDVLLSAAMALGCVWILLTLCGISVIHTYRRQAKQDLESKKMTNASVRGTAGRASVRKRDKARVKARASLVAAPGETPWPTVV